MKKILTLNLLFIGICISLQAKEYTLDECIKIAQNKSHTAIAARSSYKSRQLYYKSFIADYYPQLSLSGTGFDYARDISPVTQLDGTVKFVERNQLSNNASLFLSQNIPLTGAQISLSSGISRFESFGVGKNLLFSAFPLQVSLTQPLFKFNDQKWNKIIEDLRISQNDAKFFSDMEDIAIKTTQNFFILYLAQMSVKNAELNVAINDSLMLISRGRYNIGKIAENDLLQVELGLMNAKNDYDSQLMAYQKAADELKISLGFDKKEEMTIISPINAPFTVVDPDKAYNEALDNNPDVIDYKLSEMQSERNVAVAANQNGFQANITASYGLNQTAPILKDAYKNPMEKDGLNLTFSLPLYQWGKGSANYESSLEAEKSTKNFVDLARKEFELSMKYQAREFNLLQNQVKSYAKADTIAAKRFEVAKNRFLIGNIDLNTYFIAQNEKDGAMRSFISILNSYWASYYTLRKLTLYDFLTNKKINYNTYFED